MTGPGSYYDDKVQSLREIFGATDVRVTPDAITVDGRRYPVVDDVIVTAAESEWPAHLRGGTPAPGKAAPRTDFAEDIQFTFGEEWKKFSTILPDHERLFHAYFDQIDLAALATSRVCDLGCGMGRWSYFVAPHCRELVLVDFSDAIFVARRTLSAHPHTIFIQGDIRALPFAPDFADLIFSLGVLHHLPTPALDEVIALRPYSARLLIYLYYKLDGRPWHFRAALSGVSMLRGLLARIRSPVAREAIARIIALGVYRPLVGLGHVLSVVGLGRLVPLYEGYRGRSLRDIRLDAYDRFFTRIEQRFTRESILSLRAHFSRVEVAPTFPYWHFTCHR